MNNKLLRLRITNKRLKNKLKECNRIISFKNKTISSLAARKDSYLNQNNHLRKITEDQKDKIKYLENENKEYASRLYNLSPDYLGIEKDLKICERQLDDARSEISEYRDLSKRYEENVHRLSMKVAELTKENETLKSKGIANKLKNIFKKR